MRGNHGVRQICSPLCLCGFFLSPDLNVVVGDHIHRADVEEGTPHEVGEVVVGHRDAGGDSGHDPRVVRGDTHRSREQGMMDNGGTRVGGRPCGAVADPEEASELGPLFDVIADAAALNEMTKRGAPLVLAPMMK